MTEACGMAAGSEAADGAWPSAGMSPFEERDQCEFGPIPISSRRNVSITPAALIDV
jgi:hypothetical protein